MLQMWVDANPANCYSNMWADSAKLLVISFCLSCLKKEKKALLLCFSFTINFWNSLPQDVVSKKTNSWMRDLLSVISHDSSGEPPDPGVVYQWMSESRHKWHGRTETFPGAFSWPQWDAEYQTRYTFHQMLQSSSLVFKILKLFLHVGKCFMHTTFTNQFSTTSCLTVSHYFRQASAPFPDLSEQCFNGSSKAKSSVSS